MMSYCPSSGWVGDQLDGVAGRGRVQHKAGEPAGRGLLGRQHQRTQGLLRAHILAEVHRPAAGNGPYYYSHVFLLLYVLMIKYKPLLCYEIVWFICIYNVLLLTTFL